MKPFINLNAGTLSPTPKPVWNAVTRLRRMQAECPSDFLWRQTPRLLHRSRRALANYLHVTPDNLLLLPNVTFAMNLAITALDLPPGAEVLTTDHEYGAMMLCLRRRATERGWKLRSFKLPYTTEDPDEIVAAAKKAVRPSTRVLFFSHVTSTTGLVLPAAQLCRLVPVTIVDGAHAAGMIPLNLSRIGADFYGGNCHKWLTAPLGCGFLHVASRFKKTLKPLVTSWGWGGADWHYEMEFHGCTDRCPQMVLPEVLACRRRLGGEAALRRRSRALVEHARERLAVLGLTPVTPRNPALSGAIIAFELPPRHPLARRNRLWEMYRIEAPVTGIPGRRFLRLSLAWFNTRAEIDRLADVLKTMKKGMTA